MTLPALAWTELLVTCLLLPYAAWLLGTGLRRLAPLRIAKAILSAALGLLPLGDPSSKPPGAVGGALILAVPLIALVGLLRRPPPRVARQAVAVQPAPAPVTAVGKPVAAPELATPAPSWAASLPGAPNLLLRYQGAKREVSDREVRPIGAEGDWHEGVAQVSTIKAYCLSRKGYRTFKASRILSAADPETGELVDLQAWVERYAKMK